MAAKLIATQSPDHVDQLLYLKNAQGLYRGYKTRYISQNLSEMEGYLVTCTRCKGIIRDASSCEGETVCQLCARNQLNPKRVQKVRNSVANLNIKCPLLRDCGWSGKLVEGEKHLKECDSFLITCPLECGDVIKRCGESNHLKTDCFHREVKCEFCNLSITFKTLTEHLTMCPAHPFVCECNREFHRDEVEEHINKNCELTEIECPYAKYSCKIGKILRKDLLTHKKEFYIEHQDMIERENCLLTDKLGMYVQKHDLLEGRMKEENDQLVQNHISLEIKVQTKNDGLVQKHELLEGKYHKQKQENDRLLQKHISLESKMKADLAKHDQLVDKYDQLVRKHDLLEKKHHKLREEHHELREEHYQSVQNSLMVEKLISQLSQELRVRKRLIGTAVNLDFKAKINQSSEFGNGEYRFVCNISLSVDRVEITLNRLSTSNYSDVNVLCITEFVLRLQETATEILPLLVNGRMDSRIEAGGKISVKLDKELFSRYRQPDGIVMMEINFDYDYITYKGFLS